MSTLGDIKKGSELGYTGSNSWIWSACEDCGEERWVRLKHGKRESKLCQHCSQIRSHPVGKKYKPRDPAIAKIKKVTSQNYHYTHLLPDDFYFSMCRSGRVLDHRLVVAKSLGRCLHSWEIVHHLNHDKADNRLKNLQLVTDDRHTQITILESKIDRLLVGQKELKEEIRLLRFENKLLRDKV